MSYDFPRNFVGPVQQGDRLTAQQIQSIVTALLSSIQSDTLLVQRIGNNVYLDVELPPYAPFFVAKITGNSALTANVKWKYAWTEIKLSTNDDGAKANARSGTTSDGYALNLVELNNTTAGAVGGEGVNAGGTDYPAGFKRRPIGSAGTADTHSVDVCVLMYTVVDLAGAKRYVFSQPNAHDGTCT